VSDHADNELVENKKLSALYRAGSTAQPPANIDQAILAKARLSAKPIAPRTHSVWAVPLSVAAILVLSVSLISLIHEEAPMVSDIPINTPFSSSPITADAITESAIYEKQNNEPTIEKETPTQSPAITPRKENATREIEKPNFSVSPAYTDKTIDVPLPDSSTEQKRKLTVESFQQSAPPSGMTSADTGLDSRLKKEHDPEKNKYCESLNHQACLDSKKCNLVIDAQKILACHRSTNHCDSNFSQQSDTKESCETKNGCVYMSAPCLCLPGAVCFCDENQLPLCTPRK